MPGRGRGHARHARGGPAGRAARRLLLAVALERRPARRRAGGDRRRGGRRGRARRRRCCAPTATACAPAHPLLAAAARKHARPTQRRALHARARRRGRREPSGARCHLALAAERPDAALAGTRSPRPPPRAAARGARREAVDARRAGAAPDARRTTPRAQRAGARRSPATSRTRASGSRVTDVLTPELDALPPGGAARARLAAARRGRRGRDAGDSRAHLERALAEAGDDPALRAPRARAQGAQHGGGGRRADPRGRGVGARGAAGAAAGAEWLALRALGWTRSLRGLPIDDVCEQFARRRRTRPSSWSTRPSRSPALRLAWRGEIDAARARRYALPGARRRARRGRRVRVAAPEPVRARAARRRVGRGVAAARRVGASPTTGSS